MTDKVKPFYSILIIIAFLSVFGNQLSAQKKYILSTGFGIPELLNIGLSYHYDQFQIGMSVGTMPVPDEHIITVAGDIRYHFGGSSGLSDRRPWYGRIGLNYLKDETKNYIDKYSYLNTRIGREFNITNRFGIAIDAGAIFQLSHSKIRKTPSSGWDLDLEFPVLPSLGIGFYYSL